VGDIIFAEQTRRGFGIGENGFSGWTSGTVASGPKIKKPQGPGDYAIKRLKGGRQVSISGTCVAPSQAELIHLGELLTGLGSDGELVRVQVDQGGKTLYADAYVDGETTFEQFNGRNYAPFDIEFYFPLPQKYGEARTFASGEPAYHYGNFQAIPVITVSGSRPSGYVLNGPAGLTRAITQPLVSGQPHTIDMANGRLSIGGTVINRSSSGDTWAIPPGQRVTTTLSGAGTLVTTVRDTYF
jgi:hypothetical protein